MIFIIGAAAAALAVAAPQPEAKANAQKKARNQKAVQQQSNSNSNSKVYTHIFYHSGIIYACKNVLESSYVEKNRRKRYK